MSRSITKAPGSPRAVVCILPWLLLIAVLTFVPLAPARADFFDDARRTFQIDIPRFFEHDLPCAFGGKPTSHTDTSCKSSGHAAKSSPRRSHQAAMHKATHLEGPKVVRSYRDASGQSCRVVNETVLIDGEKTQATGTVCKQSDGQWMIHADGLDIATQPSRLGARDADVVSAENQPIP